MKNVVKIFCLSIVVAAMSSVAINAQTKGDKAVGVSFALGSGDGYSNYGIVAKYQKNIFDVVRLEGAFTYYLKKGETSMYDLSAYGHYLFKTSDVLVVYPLVGVGLWGVKSYKINYAAGAYEDEYEYDTKKTVENHLAISFGGGVDYMLTKKLVLNAEMKYKVVDYFNRFIISAGVAYRF